MDDDPRNVFLCASEVIARYGWGKTKGYQNLKDRELVPPPVMAHPDRWRLDQLLAWEERRMALAQAALDALVARDVTRSTLPTSSLGRSEGATRRDGHVDCTRERSCRVPLDPAGTRQLHRSRLSRADRDPSFSDANVRSASMQTFDFRLGKR